MSDARTRELERRWRESSRDDDCAAWISALHRSGEITRKAILALAALGHLPSSMVLEEEPTWLDPRNAIFVAAAQLPKECWVWILLAIAAHYPADSCISDAAALADHDELAARIWATVMESDRRTAVLLHSAVRACRTEGEEDATWDRFQHVVRRLIRGPSAHGLPGWPKARRLVLQAALRTLLGEACGTASSPEA